MFSARKIVYEDRDVIYSWRNRPSIRKYMVNKKLIRKSEHNKWIRRILREERNVYFIFTFNNKPCGFGSAYESDRPSTGEWGIYLGCPAVHPLAGGILSAFCISMAFRALQITKLHAEVNENNHHVYSFLTRLGFQQFEPVNRLSINIESSDNLLRHLELSDKKWATTQKKLWSLFPDHQIRPLQEMLRAGVINSP